MTTLADLRARVLAGSGEDRADWITLDVDRALVVDRGRDAILCDRLPSPVTLVLKLPLAALHYEQHRFGRGGTHGPDCHLWGGGAL